MSFLFYIVFFLSAHPAYSRWTFQNILDESLSELRTKRDASCGGKIEVAAGKTESIQLETELHNDTEFYKANVDCTWELKTQVGHIMILTTEYFSLEESDNCDWDYVQIREMDAPDRKFCGWEPFTYITTEEEIRVHFKSDVSYEDRGFKFLIDSVPVNADESKCNSSIYGGEDSKILNKDDVGASCFYRIEAPKGKVIELKLKQLDFGSAACEEESILIYHGVSNQGHSLGKICSEAIVERVLPFHVNTLFIEYRNPMGQEGDRFRIDYSFVEDTFTPAPTPVTTPSPVGGNNDCSGFYKDINTASGEMIYTAPEYQNNKECVVVVRNTLLPQHVVQIHFNYFDIEDSDDCMFDSLRILSGERNDSVPMKGPYCGESLNGRTFITNGNSVRLEFRTDVSFALRGFQAVISFIPNKECKCYGNLKCVRQGFEKRCIRASSCPHNTCMNGGTCLMSGSQQTCYCPTGYQGVDCAESDGSAVKHLHFKKAPTDRALKRNEAHFEECAVDVPASEQVQYQWTLNGVLIGEYSKVTGFGTLPGGVLEIKRFNDDLDGHYSCFAQTASGIAEHTFELRLVDDCDVRIEKGPQSERKKVGDSAMFLCLVDSRSRQIRWKKNGHYIDESKNPRFKLVSNDKYLRIENIQMEDAGKYRCEAEDKNGCYSYKEGELTVINVKSFNTYCGISIHDEQVITHAKIAGGRDAKPKENPWHVTLRSLAGKISSFCGGTLISQRFVLTAAHCITEFNENVGVPWSPDSVTLILGTTDCLGASSDTKQRRPKQYYIHPNYNKRATYDSDIALIELDSAVEYTDSIRPICLEPAAYNDRVFLELSGSLSPAFGKVAGCGSSRTKAITTTVLQEVLLQYVRRDQCIESLEKVGIQSLTDDMICAGFSVERKGDTCSGDSGGGFVMSTDQRWVQTGIVSHSIGKCDKGNYGIYTNVGNFYNWINDIAKFTEEEVPDFLSLP